MGAKSFKVFCTAMLGGVTLNGPELFSTAIAEQQKLVDEIRKNYEEPPHIMQV